MIIPDIISAGANIAFEAFLIGCSTTERISLIDTIIAATAKINGACLVHRDKHMELIPKNILDQISL
jgi:predicted nucleic acid-binding protein